LETERGSTKSHPLENSLWERLRTCRTTYYGISELKTRYTWLPLCWIVLRPIETCKHTEELRTFAQFHEYSMSFTSDLESSGVCGGSDCHDARVEREKTAVCISLPYL